MQKNKKNYHVKNLDQNFIRRSDTFSFRCTKCGNCCRNKEPGDRILLSTIDVYRAALTLDMSMTDVISNYCEMVPGRESMLPLVVLKQRLDGSCIFLKKGSCTVHEGKPLLCAMYPLNRLAFLNEETQEYDFHYYLRDTSEEGCHAARDQIVTAEQWLSLSDVEKYDECVHLYRRLGNACSRLMHAADNDNQRRELFSTSFYMMFVKYETDQDLQEQMEVNLAFIQSLRPDLFFGKSNPVN